MHVHGSLYMCTRFCVCLKESKKKRKKERVCFNKNKFRERESEPRNRLFRTFVFVLQCFSIGLVYLLDQRFSIPPPPGTVYSACLSLLTHLIQIISLLEVRSMHELCSVWHARYTGSIAPYFLSREIRWSLLHFRTFIRGFALRDVFTHGRVWH